MGEKVVMSRNLSKKVSCTSLGVSQWEWQMVDRRLVVRTRSLWELPEHGPNVSNHHLHC